MLEAILEFVAEFIARVILSLMLLPVFLAAATPLILLRSLIWPGRIRQDFAAVMEWWDRISLNLF